MDEGSSKTTWGSSNIRINSGHCSCSRRQCKANKNDKNTDIFRIFLSNILSHLHFFVIQTHCGLELGEGSGGGVSIAVHVRTAGATIQLLPAAVALSLLNSRMSSRKMSFPLGYIMTRWFKQTDFVFCLNKL